MANLRGLPEVLLRSAVRGSTLPSLPSSLYIQTTNSFRNGSFTAAVCEELGKPLVLKKMKCSECGDGQVRIGIRAAGINFATILTIQGKYQEKPDLPFIPESEIAGDVIEVGEGVNSVSKGDRVLVMSLMKGGFAEEVVVYESEIWKIPENLSYEKAAALTSSYGTAWLGLTRRAKLKKGETLFVTAAAGAVGLAAVDLASHVIGAKVIGAAGGPTKCAFVRQRGAYECIDYKSQSIRDKVKELTDREGANVIFDAVGGDVFKQCLRSIAWEGRIMVIGFASGAIPQIPANILLVKNVSVHGFYWGPHGLKDRPAFRKSVDDIIDFCAQGKIDPYIGKTFPLAKVNDAMDYILARKSMGKVVITM